MHQYYYSKTLESIYIAVGKIFSNLNIHVYDSLGVDTGKAVKVNYVSGPLDRSYLSRALNVSASEHYYISNPKIGVTLKNISFDQSRCLSQYDSLYATSASAFNDINSFFSYVNPKPENFEFEVEIRTNTLSDHTQILEQIRPFFAPDSTISIQEFSFLNVQRDLRIEIGDSGFTFESEMNQETRQEIHTTMNLVVFGFAYGPISSEAIIKTINSNYFISQGSLSVSADSFIITMPTGIQIPIIPSNGPPNALIGEDANGRFLEFKSLIAGSGIDISYAPNLITISATPQTGFTGYNQNLDTSASVSFISTSVSSLTVSGDMIFDGYLSADPVITNNNAFIYFYNDGGIPELRCRIQDNNGNNQIFIVDMTSV